VIVALGWALTGLMGLTLLLWGLFIVALIASGKDGRHTISAEGPGPDKEAFWPRVSIIIPARNEAGSIGKAVASCLAQDYRDLEVIVVDDASEDGTADEAREAGAGDDRLRVVPGRPVPPMWLGKPSACWHGQTMAAGEVLLFLDADVQIAPTTVSRTVGVLRERDLSMLSLWGTWLMESFWEKVVQPVVGGFVRGAHPLDKVNDPAAPEAFANGQFIMIRREAYDAMGGHDAVKDEVLEDVRFAQAVQGAGLACGMFLAPDLFAVRLYTSLSEIWQGMIKNFYHGMNRKPGTALLAGVFVSTTTLLPFVLLAAGVGLEHWPLAALAACNILFMFMFRFIQDGVVGLSRWYGLTHPLGTLVLVGIIAVSAWRGLRGTPTSWKGRPVKG
jgi:chlorobactene glucosyltransferase